MPSPQVSQEFGTFSKYISDTIRKQRGSLDPEDYVRLLFAAQFLLAHETLSDLSSRLGTIDLHEFVLIKELDTIRNVSAQTSESKQLLQAKFVLWEMYLSLFLSVHQVVRHPNFKNLAAISTPSDIELAYSYLCIWQMLLCAGSNNSAPQFFKTNCNRPIKELSKQKIFFPFLFWVCFYFLYYKSLYILPNHLPEHDKSILV